MVEAAETRVGARRGRGSTGAEEVEGKKDEKEVEAGKPTGEETGEVDERGEAKAWDRGERSKVEVPRDDCLIAYLRYSAAIAGSSIARQSPSVNRRKLPTSAAPVSSEMREAISETEEDDESARPRAERTRRTASSTGEESGRVTWWKEGKDVYDSTDMIDEVDGGRESHTSDE